MLRSLDLLFVLFRKVAQGNDIRVPIESVRVERDLGVEAAQVPVLGDDQRIDLEQAHVLCRECGVELRGDLLRFLGEAAREPKRLGDEAAVMRHDPGRRVDGEGDDLVRRVVRDLFDVHAALGRDHEGDAAGRAVDEHREIELALDVGPLLDVEAIDLLAGRAGLERDEGGAEHLLREGLHVVDAAGEAYTALVAGARLLEAALAAATRMNLGLHDKERPAEILRCELRLLGREDRLAAGDRKAELLQDRLSLVFVNIHQLMPSVGRVLRREECVVCGPSCALRTT